MISNNEKLNSVYQKYQTAFRNLQNHELGHPLQLNDIEKQKELESYLKLSKEYQEACVVFIEAFQKETAEQKLSIDREVFNLLEKVVKAKDWEAFFIVKDLIPLKNQSHQLVKTISWAILEILKTKTLSFEIENGTLEWSKGAMLESLVSTFDGSKNQSIMMLPLKKVLLGVEEDEAENYHLINKTISILGYINTPGAKDLLIQKKEQSKNEDLINQIENILTKDK